MAESEASGLDILIQQRKSRPSYARMISREILQSSDEPPQKSKKSSQHKTKSTTFSVEHTSSKEYGDTDSNFTDSESDDSEYFSASENFQDESEIDIEYDRKKSKTVKSGETDVSCDENLSTLLCHINFSDVKEEKKFQPCKKQKQKRRRYARKSIEGYAVPFQDVENFDFSITELSEELTSGTENVLAVVPSLYELCLRSIQSQSRQIPGIKYHLLPAPVKNAVSLYRKSQALSHLQLSCLMQTLAELERKPDKSWMTNVYGRSVWSKFCTVKRTGENQSYDYSLAGTTIAMKEFEVLIPYSYTAFSLYQHHCGTWRDPRCVMNAKSVLTSVLDMMVPIHFRPSRRKQKATLNLDEGDHAIMTCANTLLGRLSKRYPSLVETVGQRVLPYLFWLRGHIKLALEQFLLLADSATDVVVKSHYLMEAIRLCQIQDHMDSARKLIRQVHDLVSDTATVRSSTADKEEMNEQLLVLCSNTYDQGVLTEEKAMKSLASWQYLTTVPCAHATSSLAAAESVLGFHLSHFPGQNVQEKLKFVLNHLKTCSQLHWRVSMYLSLVYAWQGDRFESAKAFGRIASIDDAQGQEFKSQHVNDATFTPWETVVNVVSVNKEALKPLVVVWRTQLGFFRVIRDLDVCDGDQHGRKIGLRVSHEGHLTSDVHLLLPPVRAFNLDLYTGKLVLPHTPGHSHVQKTLFRSHHRNLFLDSPDIEYGSSSYALVSMELYSDDSGRQVHLLTAGESRMLMTDTDVKQLQLTSANGHHTKVNLRQVLKTALKEKVERDIKSKYKEPNSTNQMEALKGLEYAYTHNLIAADPETAKLIGNALEEREPKKQKLQGRKHSKSYKLPRSYVFKYKCEVKDFASFGHTVFLFGLVDYHWEFFMFIDVSSREAFVSPVIHFFHSPSAVTEVPTIIGRQDHRVPRSEVLCIYTYNPNRINIYGQGGRRLNCAGIDLQTLSFQCVLGSSMYGFTNYGNGAQDQEPVSVLTEMRFLQHTKAQIIIHNIGSEIQEVKVVADRLLLNQQNGLRILHPETMLPEPLLCRPGRECQYPLSDDNTTLLVHPVRLSVLAEFTDTSTTSSAVGVPVAINDHLLVLDIQERCSELETSVEIVFCVKVPGHVTEVCFIGQRAGYLISTTLHHKRFTAYYRETVCQLSATGQLLSILPCLGPGPRSFCPVLLPPSPKQAAEVGGSRSSLPVWHVYMRDGHEGIIAVRL